MKINELEVGKLYTCDACYVFDFIYKIDKDGVLKVGKINDGNDYFEDSGLSYNATLRNNFEEYVPEVNWSKVKVDTKVYVKDNSVDNWKPRYFAKYEGGYFYTWRDRATSWSGNGHVLPWKYCKLAEESEAFND